MLLVRKHSLILFLLTFCLAAQSQSDNKPAQPAPQTPAPHAYESATVLKTVTRMVVVDVVATDRKGQPVTDLQQSDVTVLEDGKEQEIKVFSFQHPLQAASAPIAAVKPPANVFTNVPQYLSSSALNVVLLDALNTNLLNQSYVRQQMLKYLEKLPQGSPVAVYTLSGKLQLLQDFTTDPEVLKATVKKLKGKASPVLDNPTGGPDIQMVPGGSFGGLPPALEASMASFESERISFQTDFRVRYTLEALTALAQNLAGYPGRKNLIWISESFPLTINPDLSLGANAFSDMRNYAGQVGETADALIDSQVAVYPIDARGLVGYSFYSAGNSGRDQFGRSIGRSGAAMNQEFSRETTGLQAAHGTMQDIAQKTGGKAYYNRNDIDGAIRASINDGSTYYIVAYYPTNKDWNGKFRKIHVKIKREGITARHRDGYFAVNPTEVAAAKTKEKDIAFARALDVDYPVATGLLFRAGVIPPSEKTENKVLVNFVADSHAISFETGADGLHHASLECAIQVYSEKGKPIKAEANTVAAALKPDTFRKVMQDSTFPCQKSFDLPAGSYLLRLGVRDNRTGLVGSTNAKVTIAAATPDSAKADAKP